MKKLLAIGLVVMLGAGVAFASSLSVPWFVDKDTTNCGFPPSVATTVGIIYLHNNVPGITTCSIEYYTQDGVSLGPASPHNTFTINALSTIAFRPVAHDGDMPAGGQEAPSGLAVPDRPMSSTIPGGTKFNGSLVVTWVGVPTDVQGIYCNSQNVQGGPTGQLAHWGTLLPPGA